MRKNPSSPVFLVLTALALLPPSGVVLAQDFDLLVSGEPTAIESPDAQGVDAFTHNSGVAVSANGDIGFAHNTLSGNRQQFWYGLLPTDGELERLQLGSTARLDVPSPGLTVTDDDFALLSLATGNGAELRTIGVAHQRGQMFPKIGNAVAGLEETIPSERLNFVQEGCDFVDVSVPERLSGRISSLSGRSRGQLPVLAECADARRFAARVDSDTGAGTLNLRRNDEVTPTPPGGKALPAATKGFASPPPAIGPGAAMGYRQDGLSAMVYAARGEVFPGDFPVVIEYDATHSISRIRELMDEQISRAGGAALALCGHREFPHYWVSFVDVDNRVTLVRIEGDDVTYRFLGTTLGPVDLACDPWGNVVVSWWGPTSSGNSGIFVGAINQFSQLATLRTLGLGAGVEDLSLGLGVNGNGDVAVVWTDPAGGLRIQRFQLVGNAVIEGSFMGSFFNPYFSGEGFIFDVANVNNVPSVVVYYFTYDNDGSGRQAWLVGSGPIEGSEFSAQVALATGAEFGDAFDAGDVEFTVWGTIHGRFLGCGLARVEMESDLWPRFGYLVQPLTGMPVGGSGLCAGGLESPFRGNEPPVIDATYAGSWFDPGRNGEGLVYDIVETPDGPIIVLYYFTYADDGSGRQAWLVGSAPIVDGLASVPVAYGEGAAFGPAFDPTDVSLVSWGRIIVTFESCVRSLVEYIGDWGLGEFFVLPLTAPPLGFTGTCMPAVSAQKATGEG